MSQQVFVLLFLISKMSLYEKLSANHKTHFDLSNHRSYFISDIVHFSEIKGAISYQISVTVFLFVCLPPLKILTLSHGQNSLNIPTYSRFLFFLSWSLLFVFSYSNTHQRGRNRLLAVCGLEGWGGRKLVGTGAAAGGAEPPTQTARDDAPSSSGTSLFLALLRLCPILTLVGPPWGAPSRAGLMYFSFWISKVGFVWREHCSFKNEQLESWQFFLGPSLDSSTSWDTLAPTPISFPGCLSVVCLASVFPSQLTVPQTLCLALLTFPQSSHGTFGGSLFGMLLWKPVYQCVCNYLLIRKTCAGPDRPHVCGLSHP